MFNISMSDISANPYRTSHKKCDDIHIDDFDPSDALSAFVDDDVDFMFPENGVKAPPMRDIYSEDDNLSGLQNLQWKMPHETPFNPFQSNSCDHLGGDSDIRKLRTVMTPSDDFLGLLASKVPLMESSTADVFDSEDEYYSDDGSLVSEYDKEDHKLINDNNFCGINKNSFYDPASNMPHHTINFSRPDFDLELLHGTPSSNQFKFDNTTMKPGARSRKRRKISAEEKVELTRQRNREHARSTRRRKKMYVECLKKQVAELLAKQHQIDSGTFEETSVSSVEETLSARRAIIRKFLKYRTSNVLEPSLWKELIDESFCLLQPRTPFRAANIGRIIGNSRRIKGVESVIHDTASISAMLEMITSRARQQKPGMRKNITMSYAIEQGDILTAGDRLMCHWSLNTTNLIDAGFGAECSIDGMLKCTFSSKNTILNMELTYDVMSFTRQLQKFSLIDLSVVTPDASASTRTGLPRNNIQTGCKGAIPVRPTRKNISMPSLVPNFNILKQQTGGTRGNAQGNLSALVPNLLSATNSMLPMLQLAGMQQMKIQLPSSVGCTTRSAGASITSTSNPTRGKNAVSTPTVSVSPSPTPAVIDTEDRSPAQVSTHPAAPKPSELVKESADAQKPVVIPRQDSNPNLLNGNNGISPILSTKSSAGKDSRPTKNPTRANGVSNISTLNQTSNQPVLPMLPSLMMPTRKSIGMPTWNMMPGMMSSIMPIPPFITPAMFPMAQPGKMFASQLKLPTKMSQKMNSSRA